jgi:hypothetical protein
LGDVEDITVADARDPIRRMGWYFVLLAVLLGAGAFAVIRGRVLAEVAESEAEGIPAPRPWSWWAATPARRAYLSLLRWGRWLAVSPGRTATPAEHAAALGAHLPAVRVDALAVAEAYAGERYGSRSVDAQALERAWIRHRLRLVQAWLARRGLPFLTSRIRPGVKKPR